MKAYSGDVPAAPSTFVLSSNNDGSNWNCVSCTIDSDDPNGVFSTGTFIYSDDSPEKFWLIRFDLPAAPLPPAYLETATLRLHTSQGKSTSVYRCLKPWTSSNCSWNNILGTNGLTLGVDVSSTPTYTFGAQAQGTRSPVVTSDVVNMYNGSANRGWVGIPNEAGVSTIYGANATSEYLPRVRIAMGVRSG